MRNLPFGQRMVFGLVTGSIVIGLATQDTAENALEFDTPSGGGDMLKSVYDTDDDGIVDNSEKLEGSTRAEVRQRGWNSSSFLSAR